MIRFTTTRRLADLVGRRDRAEARVPAVQRRLAKIKAERDQQAAALDQVTAQLAESHRVADLLMGGVRHVAEIASQPVYVIVRDGFVYGVHRSSEAAKDAVQQADPNVGSWTPIIPSESRSVPGWVVSGQRLPQLTDADRPPNWDAVLAYLQHMPKAAEQAKTSVLPGGEAES